MNLTHLRAFHWVAETGGVGAAARKLELTQPAVSQQLRALEQEYDVALFHRAGRRVVLSEAGRELHAVTRRLFDLASEAEDVLRSVAGAERGRLHVAADGPYHVMAILGELRRRHPQVELSVRIANSSQIVTRLLQYESDVGVLALDPRDARAPIGLETSARAPRRPAFRVLRLRTDRVVVLVAAGHRWASRKSIALHETADEPFIAREAGSATRGAFEQATRAASVQVRTALELGSREAVREAVAAGLGFGVVSEPEVGHDTRVRAVPLSRPVVKTREYLVCLEERTETRLIKTMFEIASAGTASGTHDRPRLRI